jgi:Domain of unknown function (DUF5667)
MSPVFGARRRAEEFHSLVEDPSTGGLHDARYADFLDIVASLRDVPQAQPRPAFVADLREQLMSAAETVLVASDDDARLALRTRRTGRPVRERRLAAAAAGLAVVGATTSMAMAAQSALPGDALYPLKRMIEGAETGIAVNEGEKGETLLANASGRLAEITALSRDGRLEDGDAIADTFNDFTRQAIAASDLLLTDYAATGDESSIAELRDFTGQSMQTLAELETVVPEQARDELLRAARVLTQIDAQAEQACPSCGGHGIDEIPAILTSSYDTASGVAATPGTVLQVAPKEKESRERHHPAVPQTGGESLPPGSVLTPGEESAEAGASSPGGAATQQHSSGPLKELADTLTGGGSEPVSGPETPEAPAAPEAPDLGEVVEDVTDPLLN